MARWLAWASLAWMTVEGAVGLTAGLTAGSIALVGGPLSSVVEGLASLIVIWRFTGSRTLSATAEERAQRAVAVSFWLLGPTSLSSRSGTWSASTGRRRPCSGSGSRSAACC